MAPELKSRLVHEMVLFGKVLFAVLATGYALVTHSNAVIGDKVDDKSRELRNYVHSTMDTLREQETTTYVLFSHRQAALSLKVDTSFDIVNANQRVMARKLDRIIDQLDK